MKKINLFLAGAVAMAMAACTQTEIEMTPTNDSQEPISFVTFNEKTTRAENSSATDTTGLEKHHTTFALWGYKDVQDSVYVFGKNAASKASKTPTVLSFSTEWSYSPTRYWDKNSNKYVFYAAAPSTGISWVLNQNVAGNQNDDYFTLADVTLKNKTLTSVDYVESMKGQSNTDLMIASAKTVVKANYGTDPVVLEFNHILSRLNIAVKKGAALKDSASSIMVDSIEVLNMVMKGSFDESKDTTSTLASGTHKRWTLTKTETGKYVSNSVDSLSADTVTYVLQSLVMPQAVKCDSVSRDGRDSLNNVLTASYSPYIKISYKVGREDPENFIAFYNLAGIFGKQLKDSLCFNEGWQYNLNIVIDPTNGGNDGDDNKGGISFVPSVFKWQDNKAAPQDTLYVK